mgnify:CR=1 FL=1
MPYNIHVHYYHGQGSNRSSQISFCLKKKINSQFSCLHKKSLNFIYFTTITKQVYTTYINHAFWHQCLRSDGLPVGENWSARSTICT